MDFVSKVTDGLLNLAQQGMAQHVMIPKSAGVKRKGSAPRLAVPLLFPAFPVLPVFPSGIFWEFLGMLGKPGIALGGTARRGALPSFSTNP